MWSSLFLAGLRSSALLLKFCLYLYLASFAGAEMLGWLGLITAFIIMYSAVGDAGILQTIARDSVTSSLKSTLIELRLYVRCLPFFFFCIALAGVACILCGYNSVIICLSVLIIFSELLNNNLFIFLMNKHKPFHAQWLYVIRSGAWIPLFIVVTYLYPEFLKFEFLLLVWSVFSFGVVLFTLFVLKLLRWSRRCHQNKLQWLLNKIKSACSLLKLNFLMALNDCAASFLLSVVLGVEKLGIYIYFQQVGSALMNIIRYGIVQPLWPTLIKGYEEQNLKPYKMQLNHLSFVMIISLVSALIAFPVYKLISQLLGHVEFEPYFSLFIPVLLLFLISSFGCIQDSIFYAVKKEGILNRVLLYVLPLNCGLILIMSLISGLYGVVWGITFMAGMVVLYKQVRLVKIPAK